MILTQAVAMQVIFILGILIFQIQAQELLILEALLLLEIIIMIQLQMGSVASELY